MMDAFLTDRTISLLHDMSVSFYVECYERPQPKRTCQKTDTADSFLSSLVADLKGGKHVFLFCTSHNKLTQSILPHLRQELPGLTSLEYHRSSQLLLAAEDVNQM
jgi:hypothetical protein